MGTTCLDRILWLRSFARLEGTRLTTFLCGQSFGTSDVFPELRLSVEHEKDRGPYQFHEAALERTEAAGIMRNRMIVLDIGTRSNAALGLKANV